MLFLEKQGLPFNLTVFCTLELNEKRRYENRKCLINIYQGPEHESIIRWFSESRPSCNNTCSSSEKKSPGEEGKGFVADNPAAKSCWRTLRTRWLVHLKKHSALMNWRALRSCEGSEVETPEWAADISSAFVWKRVFVPGTEYMDMTKPILLQPQSPTQIHTLEASQETLGNQSSWTQK